MGLELPRWARNLIFGVAASSLLMFASGCSAAGKNQVERLAMPVPRTDEAQDIYDLWQWAWLAALLTGALVWGLIFYVMVRYRRRSETEVPVQTRYNLPIEIFYTIAPIMMVIVLFYYVVQVQNNVVHWEGGNPNNDNVTVVGQQWSWTFNYDSVAALDGKTVYDVGTTADAPTLWLVEGKKVNFDLYSPDVIHSFWVPAFLFKMDVVPGREKQNHFTLRPNHKGTFAGHCAEFCGLYHSKMLFNVKVVSQADFDAHMVALEKKGQVGKNLGGSEVGKQAGLQSNGGEQ